MATVVTIIHVLACIFLVLVVLLQTGKGADMGAVFGGSSSTIFGSSGAGNFLTRLTTVMAAVFMLTSLTLTYVGSRRVTSTVFDTAPLPAAPQPLDVPPAGAPAPGAAAPAPAAEGQPAPQAANVEPQPAAEAAAPAAPAPQEAPAAAQPEAAK